MDKKLISVGLASLCLGGLIGGGIASSNLKKPCCYNNFDSMHTMMMNDAFYSLNQIQRDLDSFERNFEKKHHYLTKNISQNISDFKMDVKKDDEKKEYQINLELPQGVDAKNIKTNVNQHQIILKGDFESQKHAEDQYIYSGSNFYKSFNVPEELDFNKVYRKIDKNKMIIKIPYKS